LAEFKNTKIPRETQNKMNGRNKGWISKTCRKRLSKRQTLSVTESRTTGAIVPQSQCANPKAWVCAKLNSFELEGASTRNGETVSAEKKQ